MAIERSLRFLSSKLFNLSAIRPPGLWRRLRLFHKQAVFQQVCSEDSRRKRAAEEGFLDMLIFIFEDIYIDIILFGNIKGLGFSKPCRARLPALPWSDRYQAEPSGTLNSKVWFSERSAVLDSGSLGLASRAISFTFTQPRGPWLRLIDLHPADISGGFLMGTSRR